MAKKKINDIKELTCLQICNELKLVGLNRKVVEKSFLNDKKIKEDWIKELKNIGLDF